MSLAAGEEGEEDVRLHEREGEEGVRGAGADHAGASLWVARVTCSEHREERDPQAETLLVVVPYFCFLVSFQALFSFQKGLLPNRSFLDCQGDSYRLPLTNFSQTTTIVSHKHSNPP